MKNFLKFYGGYLKIIDVVAAAFSIAFTLMLGVRYYPIPTVLFIIFVVIPVWLYQIEKYATAKI